MLEVGRPEDYEEQIANSLSRLTSADVLIHLGDVCLGNDAEAHKKYIEPLKCRKILVKGNHDQKSLSWYMEHGWGFACNRMTLDFGGETLHFSHIPLPPDDFFGRNIHGHLHNVEHRSYPKWYSERHSLVSLERQGYKAQRLDTFIQSR